MAIVATDKVFLARLAELTKPQGPLVPITPTEAIVSLVRRGVRWDVFVLRGAKRIVKRFH
ncbi:MAG TPA: hypothetical protein DDZ51_27195 [Planctomycetaceae bacterium]|nr:hypothetical protein [Planctomycetaceae bacterium]